MKINNKEVAEMVSVNDEMPPCNGVPYLVTLTFKHLNVIYSSIATFYSGAKTEWDFSWSYNKNGLNLDKEAIVTHWGYLPTHKNVSL